MTTTPKTKTTTSSTTTAAAKKTTAPAKSTTAATRTHATRTPKTQVMAKTVSQLEDLLVHASPEELAEFGQALKEYLPAAQIASQVRIDISKDMQLSDNWREGGYPYKYRLSRKNYEAQKYKLQIELLKLQHYIKATGQKLVIIFEGRDAASYMSASVEFSFNPASNGSSVLQKYLSLIYRLPTLDKSVFTSLISFIFIFQFF